MPPTDTTLVNHQILGQLVERRSINLVACEAPQRTARGHVRALLSGRTGGDRVEEAVLVADELVGNAVQHTDGPVALVLEVFTHGAVVGVVDVNGDIRAVPVAPLGSDTGEAEDPAEGGRGLLIVDLYATSWAVEPTSEGKMVVATFMLAGGER